MAYRAQFPFSTPPGFRDEWAEYYFDETSVGALAVTLTPGQILANIPLLLSNSSTGTFLTDFLLRGIGIGENAAADNILSLGIRFRDAVGNYLSNDFESLAFYESLNVDAATHGSWFELYEPELPFPKGAVFLIDLINLSTKTNATVNPFPIRIVGVHRFDASTE